MDTPVSNPRPKAAPRAADPQKIARESWTFRRAFFVLVALTFWAPLVGWLTRSLQEAEGGGRIGFALGLFAAILPLFATLAFRPWYVFEFFRSVRVGVTNLMLIGCGSILGVLFFQEDADFPIPKGAVESLASWAEADAQRPWTSDEFFAYDTYASLSGRGAGFRNAQAFFAYRLAEGLGLDGVFGLEKEYDIDFQGIQARLDPLKERLPELEARFGTDFSIALASQSETGLLTQGRDRRIGAIEEKFDAFWWSLFVWSDRFDLIRVYKSDWFAMYWAILFCGVLVNTFRGGWRRLLRPARWGFVMTHVGVMMVCLGGLWSRINEQRGILELNVNRSSDAWKTWSGDTRGFHGEWTRKGEAPFAVRLTGFRADHHDVLSINYLKSMPDGRQDFEFALDRQPEERLWKGKVLRYDRVLDANGKEGEPQLIIEVLDKVEQSVLDQSLRPAEVGEIGHPMARLALIDSHGHRVREAALAAALEIPFVHPNSGSRVLLAAVEDEEQAAALLAEKPRERWGILQRASADSSHKYHDIVPGLRFEEELPDGIYSVEVLDAQPFLQVQEVNASEIVPAPLDREVEFIESRNPAVQLRIVAPNGEVETRWVLAADTGNSLPVKFAQLRYGLIWDDWASPARQRYLLLMSPTGGLWWGQVGQPDSLRAVTQGSKFAMGEDGAGFDGGPAEFVELVQALPNASVSPEYLPKAGVDFFDTSPAAVLLGITIPGPEGPITEEVWLRTKQGRQREVLRYTVANGDQRELVLLFREQAEALPIEWQSRLQILAEDPATQAWATVDESTVRVNDYFLHKGYRFFQTNHDPRDPTYSGIGVVYDPGIPWVLTGYYLVMFGTAVVFLLRPLITRRHRAV
jgi:hypothetical protein